MILPREQLLAHFGSLEKLFQATADELICIDGVGEATAALILLVTRLHNPVENLLPNNAVSMPRQHSLFADDVHPELSFTPDVTDLVRSDMRTFTVTIQV